MENSLVVADRMNWWANQRVPLTTIQYLPFTIKLVQTHDDLLKAVQVRHGAYARHLPDFAKGLELPEDADYETDTLVLLALSKLDGQPIGSIRMQSNFHRPLYLQASVDLPDWLEGKRLVEVTRLAVVRGQTGSMVNAALIKACFQICDRTQMHYAIVTGRSPLDRQYEHMLFADVFEDKQPVPLRHVGGIPHRVMSFEIATGKKRWEAAKHPMLDFFTKVAHPDIDIGSVYHLGAAWTA